MSRKSRRPNWAYWRQMPRAKLYECVALALNIDPLKLEHSPLVWMADRLVFDEGPRFAEALGQAEVAVTNGALPAYTADPDLALASVPLDCFVDWARAVGWRLPPELAALAAASGCSFPGARFSEKPERTARRTKPKPRGPTPGRISRFEESDRTLFPEITRLMQSGHLSELEAAKKLAADGKVAGRGGEESRARRLAALYKAANNHR